MAAKDSNNVKAEALTGYNCQMQQRGKYEMPFYCNGGFGVAIKMVKNGAPDRAMKVWEVAIDDIKERMELVTEFLKSHPMPYFVGYEFCEKGFFVDGELLDILVMDWADGDCLKKYIHHLYDKNPSSETVTKNCTNWKNLYMNASWICTQNISLTEIFNRTILL